MTNLPVWRRVLRGAHETCRTKVFDESRPLGAAELHLTSSASAAQSLEKPPMATASCYNGSPYAQLFVSFLIVSLSSRARADTGKASEQTRATGNGRRVDGQSVPSKLPRTRLPTLSDRRRPLSQARRFQCLPLGPRVGRAYSSDAEYASSIQTNGRTPTPGEATRHSPQREKWYARRLAEKTVTPADLLFTKDAQSLQAVATTTEVPTCVVQVRSAALKVVPACSQTIGAAADTVVRLLTDGDRGTPTGLTVALTALAKAVTSTRDDLFHVLRVAEALQQASDADIPVNSISAFLEAGVRAMRMASAPKEEADRLVALVMAIGHARGLFANDACSTDWCAVLLRAGLWFEAALVESHGYDVSRLLFEPVCKRAVAGFGGGLMDLRRSVWDEATLFPQRFSDRLFDRFPRGSEAYARDLCCLSCVRAAQERCASEQHGSCATEPAASTAEALLPSPLFTQRMTALQSASHIHFVLRCGNRTTAALLLPECRTRQQVVTLAKFTNNAGPQASMDTVKRLLALRPSEKVYVAVRLGSDQCLQDCLLFDVRSTQVAPRSAPQLSGEDFSSERYAGGAAFGDASCLTVDPEQTTCLPLSKQAYRAVRAAVLAVSPPLPASNPPSLEVVLAQHVPATAIPLIARALGGYMTSDVASWWTALLLHAGRTKLAMAVLRASTARGVLPKMVVLVELLEASTSSEDALADAIHFVRSHYPEVCGTVFRAFVERAAVQAEGQITGSLNARSASAALEFLSTVALLRLSHFPVKYIQHIALGAPLPVRGALLKLLRSDSADVRSGGSPALPALCVDAVMRLLEAAHYLRLRVEVDVFAVSLISKDVAWWSSSCWCAPPRVREFASPRLYRLGLTSLWFVSATELSWGASLMSHQDVHKSMRVIAAGCRDGATVVRTFKERRSSLLWKPHRWETGRSGRRARREELRYIWTVAFLCETLSLQGFCEEALELLPSSAAETPKLLKLARLRVLARSPRLRSFGHVPVPVEEENNMKTGSLAAFKRNGRRGRQKRAMRRRAERAKQCTDRGHAGPHCAEARPQMPFSRAMLRLLESARAA